MAVVVVVVVGVVVVVLVVVVVVVVVVGVVVVVVLVAVVFVVVVVDAVVVVDLRIFATTTDKNKRSAQFLGWMDFKTGKGIGFRIVLENTSLMPFAYLCVLAY